MSFGSKYNLSVNNNQDFMWLAEYNDNSELCEFNQNLSENSFYDIDKNKLSKYGLIGLNYKMYFNIDDGIFNIANKNICISFKDNNGNTYNLTNNSYKYNDIIQFKEAESSFIFGYGSINKIVCFNFGYKNKIKINDIDMNFKVICKVPYDEPINFEISLTTNKDLDGCFIINSNGQEFKISTNIKNKINNTVKWILC